MNDSGVTSQPAAAPVITIDGPSASGKGTVAQRVATALGFHYLDSGSLYRLTALAARRRGLRLDHGPAVAALAASLPVRFGDGEIHLDGDVVTDAIRTEQCSADASAVAALGEVRAALLERQRAFRQPPGLVADGRDMGTVVFVDAPLKVFLTASVDVRAARRHNQLKQKGIAATLPDLLQDLRERDARDAARSVAPLRPAPDSHWLDTTAMNADAAVEQVLKWWREPA